jgi:hypothetical protein
VKEIPCTCGHSKKVHRKLKTGKHSDDLACFIVGAHTTPEDCPCYKYVADNLMYVEQEAKRRNLI